MDLTTKYLGFELKNPLVASASPLTMEIDSVKEMEEYGASAIVMHSLFEEQILHEQKVLDTFLTSGSESFAEALSYFPQIEEYNNKNGEEYLEQILKLKKSVNIPIIASLNGVSKGGWMEYAKKIEEAGADAIELNIYYIPTNFNLSSAEVEQMYINDLLYVKKEVTIPVAIKLNPFFSSFANMAKRLDEAGVDGLVLFNRFYEPDIDLKELEVTHNLEYSTSYEMRLPLKWIAILYGNIKANLALTTGIHTSEDVIKAMMVGADVVMMTSLLLQKGTKELANLLNGIKEWMEENEYSSISQMKGSMSYKSIASPSAYERANYMKTLQSIK